MENTLTMKFKGMEATILDEMVSSGLFATKTEVVRSALVKYASDLGLFSRKELWKSIESHERRNVSPDQLKLDLEKLEDEA